LQVLQAGLIAIDENRAVECGSCVEDADAIGLDVKLFEAAEVEESEESKVPQDISGMVMKPERTPDTPQTATFVKRTFPWPGEQTPSGVGSASQ
jgi:hypothetical protein